MNAGRRGLHNNKHLAGWNSTGKQIREDLDLGSRQHVALTFTVTLADPFPNRCTLQFWNRTLGHFFQHPSFVVLCWPRHIVVVIVPGASWCRWGEIGE